MDALAQFDVFSMVTAVVALLLAAGLMAAYWVNPKLTAFRWWAASFVLLSLAIATQTLRFSGPSYWIKSLSWASFYAAACLVTYGLYRVGAIRALPRLAMLAGALLYFAIAGTLVATEAPPHSWFLMGPVPVLVFMAWCLVPVLRARAWGYGLAMGGGIAAIAIRATWFTMDLLSRGPIRRAELRGGLVPDGEAPEGIMLGPGRAGSALLDLRAPLGGRPPVEQPLTVALITIAALLGLAAVLVLRDVLASINHMHERSTTDAMTGLLNRVTFDERAETSLDAAMGKPVCLMLFDIDHFKRVNDTCGHLAGDRVIARLGHLIGENIDGATLAGRIGGEEFAVLLTGSNLSSARLFAEAIRTRFSAAEPDEGVPWEVTVSAGIAMRDGTESLASLIARADKALYAAKARGRDQVAIAADTAERALRRALPA